MDPDERIHVSTVHTMLEEVVALTKDELLGVKAGTLSVAGDAGLFDFVLSSAETLRAAFEAATRYIRLLNDALDCTLEVRGERAIVRFESRVVLPAIAEDYQTCAMISNHAPCWPDGIRDDMDVWFRHRAPVRAELYHEALGPARLHFQAPMSGFGVPSRLLDAPLATSNHKLHEVLRSYAELSLASLPKPASTTERVRTLVAEHLASGEFSLEDTARALCVSPRTLGRRLTNEGTTFKGIVDELRKNLALHYVATRDTDLCEIAALAGFTETPSFYRAFRRWTGTTPTKYRWAHRVGPRVLRALERQSV